MKQKTKYYNCFFHIRILETMEYWFRYKDFWEGHLSIKESYNIELQPKRRHRRSVTPRTLKRLCGYTCFREEAHKCRLFVY